MARITKKVSAVVVCSSFRAMTSPRRYEAAVTRAAALRQPSISTRTSRRGSTSSCSRWSRNWTGSKPVYGAQ